MAKTAGPTRQQIETDIRKKQFAPIYLLMGEESFYIDRIADMILKNALTEEEKDFNLTTYYGADATMADVVLACRRYPMMAERQVVFLKEAQAAKTGHQLKWDQLQQYALKPTPTTVLVVCHKGGSLKAAALTKAIVQSGGVVFESAALREFNIDRAVSEYAGTVGCKLDPRAQAMLIDHIGAALLENGLFRQNAVWQGGVRLDFVMRMAGRLAFPIFAFMAVEGYFHTHSFKKYAQRMLIFALLSEIPFDLMYGGTWFYPVHQNVIWTLLIGLLGIRAMEAVREKGKTWLYLLTCVVVTVLGFALGTLGMVDYYGMGVLTVFVFYFLRGREWWKLLGQIAALYWINVSLIGGQIFPIELFGLEFEVCEQGLALLSLVPIWLYRGRQGHHSKVFQYACYAFYPVHMLILGLIQLSL